MTTKLRTIADDMLRSSHGDANKAAPRLARALLEDANRAALIALCADYLARLPKAPAVRRKRPEPVGRRREGKHRRQVGTPSAAAKAGAVTAMQAIHHEIFQRRVRGVGRLGNIHVHELRAIAESQATTAASFLQRGYDDAVEAIALTTLSGYCVAADPFAKVPDVIPAKVAVKAFEDAKIKAAEVIRDGSAKIASDLIASARELPSIEEGAQQ
jgi:hypothetical protein